MPAILGSVLLHALVAVLLLWRPAGPDPRLPEPAIAVDLIPEPSKPAKTIGAPLSAETAKPIPNLDSAALAEIATKAAGAGAPLKPIVSEVSAKPNVSEVSAKPTVSKVSAKPTASERDRVLAQVLRHWKPPPELVAFTDAEFKVQVTVLADGTLAVPFSVRSAYDPGAAIDGWNALHPDDPVRRGSETFYRALRQAQPLRLSAALAAKAPFPLILDFRIKDVR